MSRAYFDIDKQADRERRLLQQNIQKQMLDEQNASSKVGEREFADGRMSSEEYARYEKSSLNYFKEALLNRIQNSPRQLSSYDLIQADQFAAEDSEFAKRLTLAKQGIYSKEQPPSLPYSPASNVAAQPSPQPSPQERILTIEPLPTHGNIINQHQPMQYYFPDDQTRQDYEQRQFSGTIVPVMQMMMQQFNFQQQQLLQQLNQPNQQIIQMLGHIISKPGRTDDTIQKQVNALQAQLNSLSSRIEKQELDRKIKQVEKEREKLSAAMRRLRDEKEAYTPSTLLHRKGKLSLKQIESRNRARAQAINMIGQEFRQQKDGDLQ